MIEHIVSNFYATEDPLTRTPQPRPVSYLTNSEEVKKKTEEQKHEKLVRLYRPVPKHQ